VVWICDFDDFDARKTLSDRARSEGKVLGMPVPYAVFHTHGGRTTVVAGTSLAGTDDEPGEMVSGVEAYNRLYHGALRVGVLTKWPSFNDGGWRLRKGRKLKSGDGKGYGLRSKADFDQHWEAAADRWRKLGTEEWEPKLDSAPPPEMLGAWKAIIDDEFLREADPRWFPCDYT
jgi:hypothetical protein